MPNPDDGGLKVVASGSVKPPSDSLRVHFRPVPDDHFSVNVVHVVAGCEDMELPMTRPDFGLYTLLNARGSHVVWPCVWVSFTPEVSPPYLPLFMFCYSFKL